MKFSLNFTTDLSIGQIVGYIYTVLTGGIDGIESYRIPWTAPITA